MNKTLCNRAVADRTATAVDFGMADKTGRALGAKIETNTTTFTLVPDGQTWGSITAPGVRFHAMVQPTRNGEWFGAVQSGKYFDTTAERDAYIAKRLADMRKAYAAKIAAGKV